MFHMATVSHKRWDPCLLYRTSLNWTEDSFQVRFIHHWRASVHLKTSCHQHHWQDGIYWGDRMGTPGEIPVVKHKCRQFHFCSSSRDKILQSQICSWNLYVDPSCNFLERGQSPIKDFSNYIYFICSCCIKSFLVADCIAWRNREIMRFVASAHLNVCLCSPGWTVWPCFRTFWIILVLNSFLFFLTISLLGTY